MPLPLQCGGDEASWWEVRFEAATPPRLATGEAPRLTGSHGCRLAVHRRARPKVAFGAVAEVPPADLDVVQPPPPCAPDRMALRSRQFWAAREARSPSLRAPCRITPAAIDPKDLDEPVSGEATEGQIQEDESAVVTLVRRGNAPIGLTVDPALTLLSVAPDSLAAAADCGRFVGWRLSVANGAGLSGMEDYAWFVEQCPDDIELRFVERGIALEISGAENDCSGRYEQVLGQKVNDHTVWRKVGGDRYLYSQPAGKWIVADRESMSHGGGWMITAKKHGGLPPYKIEKWKQTWMAKKADDDIKIKVSEDQSSQQVTEESSETSAASSAKPTAYGGFGDPAAPAAALSGIAKAEARGTDVEAPLVEETRPDPSQPDSMARYTKGEFISFYGPEDGTVMWARAGESLEQPKGAEPGDDPDAERRKDPGDPEGKSFTRKEFIQFYGSFHGPIQWDRCDPNRVEAPEAEDDEEQDIGQPIRPGARVEVLTDLGASGFGRTARSGDTGRVVAALSGGRFDVEMDSGATFSVAESELRRLAPARNSARVGSLANPKGAAEELPVPPPPPAPPSVPVVLSAADGSATVVQQPTAQMREAARSPPRPADQPRPPTTMQQPAADPTTECYPVGTVLEVHGLEKKAHLNGRLVEVLSLKMLKDGRTTMLCDLGGNEKQILLPKNVRRPALPALPPPAAAGGRRRRPHSPADTRSPRDRGHRSAPAPEADSAAPQYPHGGPDADAALSACDPVLELAAASEELHDALARKEHWKLKARVMQAGREAIRCLLDEMILPADMPSRAQIENLVTQELGEEARGLLQNWKYPLRAQEPSSTWPRSCLKEVVNALQTACGRWGQPAAASPLGSGAMEGSVPGQQELSELRENRMVDYPPGQGRCEDLKDGTQASGVQQHRVTTVKNRFHPPEASNRHICADPHWTSRATASASGTEATGRATSETTTASSTATRARAASPTSTKHHLDLARSTSSTTSTSRASTRRATVAYCVRVARDQTHAWRLQARIMQAEREAYCSLLQFAYPTVPMPSRRQIEDRVVQRMGEDARGLLANWSYDQELTPRRPLDKIFNVMTGIDAWIGRPDWAPR
eukprot:TRINITY_DN5117_c0_g2_i5.p1 TRINITY_DN5117_c0_g2~~TRINITY_DN5117_c0_g2_i5.p1  ORF type:complete len:1127 (+),score=269.58 TRINITY_DN5117_c0_g2_i5:100-3381(+)